VILLDTHVWVWWVAQPDRLQPKHRDLLEFGADRVFGVSIISCWEIAKLVEYGRLKLDRKVGIWIESALEGPGVSLLHLNPQIVVESYPTTAAFSSRSSRPIAGRDSPGPAVSDHD
jgi:PIN domain nuclease of toxin-antitoxin system